MKPHFFERETKLYRPLEEIFAFFSNAENLGKVTPDEVQFTILTPFPIHMQVGTLIDYRIKLMGIPFFWRTQISDFEPPHRFVDQQLKGPYVFWHHEHTFEQKDGYVLMTDRVHYLSPGWFLEPLIDALFVKKQLNTIWDYRDKTFNELFGAHTVSSVKNAAVV
jgi:ligand-binding SRPBCC domain-containing protein